MKSRGVGRDTRRGRWPAAILGAVVLAVVGTGLWAGGAGAATGSHPLASAPAQQQSARVRAAAGTTGGIITMREGNMDMAMTRLSGKAPTWAELQRVYTMVHSAEAATAKY